MFERFSEASKTAMQIANQEAIRAGCEFIGAEHILVGVFLTKTGVGAEVLRSLGVDLPSLRAAVGQMQQLGLPGKLPMTPPAKSAIEEAIMAARSEQTQSIETEHLLLGLISASNETPVSLILVALGISPDAIRAEIQRLRNHESN